MNSPVEVAVKQGRLQGTVIPATDEKVPGVYAFVGVPYAKPPLGDLRFQAPQPPEPWQGVRPVQDECPYSLQRDAVKNFEVVGSEDCLYLNVFTPGLPPGCPAHVPVMVWFHPGSFTSGKVNNYLPQTLCGHGVVVVAVTYRLGPLGFLSLNSKKLPGNAGLKDAVAALRWVRDNISAFGGDPGRVTVFGSSAGAGITHFLQFAPAARGLFHRAISQSGSAMSCWSCLDAKVSRRRAFRLGELLGCRTQDEDQLLDCLRRAPAEDVLLKSLECFETDQERCMISTAFYACSEEGTEGSGEEMFLVDSPRSLMYSNRFYPVPWIAGMSEWEGFVTALRVNAVRDFWYSDEQLENADKDLERFIPSHIDVPKGSKESKAIADGMRRLYFDGGPVTRTGYFAMCTDVLIGLGTHESARLQSAHPLGTPVFLYLFTLSSPHNKTARAAPKGQIPPGASHGDELVYLFDGSPFEPGSAEWRVRDWFTRMWASFAKTGNPTEDPELKGIDWTPLAPSLTTPASYLDVGSTLSIPTQPVFKERMAFWEDMCAKHCKRSKSS